MAHCIAGEEWSLVCGQGEVAEQKGLTAGWIFLGVLVTRTSYGQGFYGLWLTPGVMLQGSAAELPWTFLERRSFFLS